MEVSGKLAEVKQDSQFCEHCQFDNVTSEANGICRECREYMCDTCFRNHIKSKGHRSHQLIDINDPGIAAWKTAEEVENCKYHDNEAIKFYCRKHEMVGCGDCIILEHSVCKPEYIKDLSKNIQENEDFINLKRKIERLERKNKANNENIRKKRKDFKAMHEEVLAEISKFRTDINTYLDKAEAAIMSEMEQLMSDNDKRLDQLGNECAKCLSDIVNLKQTFDPTVEKENVLFIQTVRSKASILEIEHELSKTVQSVCEVKRYEFVPNQQLASIVKSRGKFGQLNISNINESKPYEPTHLENNVDTLSLVESRKPAQLETDRETGVGSSSVVVGSRVKINRLDQSRRERLRHGGKPGTVTAVHPDGAVTVNWDYSGKTWCYRIGTGPGELKLI